MIHNKKLTIRKATLKDANLLAQMNWELNHDESSDNKLTLHELSQRMKKRMHDHWTILLIHYRNKLIGYNIFKLIEGHHPTENHIAMKGIYIKKTFRHHGIGSAAFKQIMKTDMPQGYPIRAVILINNLQSQRFFQSLGFRQKATIYVKAI